MKERYSTVYSLDGDYRLRQASFESDSEYVVMERGFDGLFECERDEVQRMLSEVYDV